MKEKKSPAPAGRKRTAPRYIVVHQPDYWIDHDTATIESGFLLFNKLTGSYHAWVSELRMQFRQLPQGGFKPDDCPLDESQLPEADLLMLLALRRRFKEHAPGSEAVARHWRRLALQKRSMEIRERKGKTVSEENMKRAMEIADDVGEFEKFAGIWLVGLVKEDRAGDILIRFGKWLNRVSDIESETIEVHYQRFFDAVAEAASLVKGVPTQAAVRKIYEKGLSANQLGEGTGFRSVMEHLQFGWLPPAGRGPGQPKISGIKSER